MMMLAEIDIPITPTDLVWIIVIPAFVALVIGALLWQPWKKDRAARAAWAAPLVMGIGFLIASPYINSGHWRWPLTPREASDWLPWIGLVALVIGLLAALTHAPRWAWFIVVLVITSAAIGVMLRFKFRAAWTPMTGAAILAGFGAVAACWWAILEQATEESPIFASWTIWLIGVGIALTLMPASNPANGEQFLALAAGAGGIGVLSIWRSKNILLRGLPIVFATIGITVLASSYYLSTDRAFIRNPFLFATLLGSPLFLLITIPIPKSKLSPFKRLLIRFLIAAIPLAAVATVATVRFLHSQQTEQLDEERI
jgi:hypothetical protein